MPSDKIERVMAVVEGRRPDRPPVGFWYHFDVDQRSGPAAVQAHLDHLNTYDLDFLKVMNDNGYPGGDPIRSVADLNSLRPLRGDEPEFVRQLELINALSKELSGRVLMATTVFNALATLRRLMKSEEERNKHGPPNLAPAANEVDRRLGELLAEDRGAVSRALSVIGESLARFVSRCLDAGADGVFLSVRDDWVDAPDTSARTYEKIVRPTDLRILEAACGARFNLLHVCGCAVNFDAFAEYPVHVINWADRAAGPSIADVCGSVRPAICGGVDNLGVLPEGTPDQCAEQVRDAIAQAGDRPILIAPGCTFDPQQVPRENLQAVCRAVRSR